MSTEHVTTAQQGAAQLRRLRDEKDARTQQQRQRPLPTWLASRRNRRIVAVLPVVPLACGVVAGFLPDSLQRSALMAAVGALSVGGILLLRRATRLLDAVPDRLLDEREIGERNYAYRQANALVIALIGLLTLLAVADGALAKINDSTLISADGWIPITLTTMLVSTMMSAAVVAWQWADPINDD